MPEMDEHITALQVTSKLCLPMQIRDCVLSAQTSQTMHFYHSLVSLIRIPLQFAANC